MKWIPLWQCQSKLNITTLKKVELLYWIALNVSGVPDKVATECSFKIDHWCSLGENTLLPLYYYPPAVTPSSQKGSKHSVSAVARSVTVLPCWIELLHNIYITGTYVWKPPPKKHHFWLICVHLAALYMCFFCLRHCAEPFTGKLQCSRHKSRWVKAQQNLPNKHQ